VTARDEPERYAVGVKMIEREMFEEIAPVRPAGTAFVAIGQGDAIPGRFMNHGNPQLSLQIRYAARERLPVSR
ncbi:MAG: hypothetical protein IH969_00005, partial [Candidatus Krumholzibacteriota bacterium]|nr:hypothetical protein [Candidatus Krumholzibacteriota bacterium]